jgi:hypothetical protein
MTRLFSMFTHNRVKELIRCEVPETLSLDKKQRLLEGIVNLQMALVESEPVFIELMYNGQFWKFSLNDTHALSFHSDCLWIPDNSKQTIIPFNLHYITEIYCTTVSQ